MLNRPPLEEYIEGPGKIRDLINKPRKHAALIKEKNRYGMLCSCLDTIGDTDRCLEAFITTDIDELDTNGKYVYIYGTVQAFVVQQDSVRHLLDSLNISYTLNPSSPLKNIRDIRNGSTGHPTKTETETGDVFNFIPRNTIGNQGFQLNTYYLDGGKLESKYEFVNIPDLIAIQRDTLKDYLDDIIKTLKQEEIDHRIKFAADKLVDIFQFTESHFQKISEVLVNPDSVHAPQINVYVNEVLKSVQDFKTELQKRELLDAYEGIASTIEEVDDHLKELQIYFCNPNETNINEKDTCIFTDPVQMQVGELKQFAQDLDDEYSQ